MLYDPSAISQLPFDEMRSYYATDALICYDYCLTFDREVKYFWKAKLTPMSLLFYVIRYSAVTSTALIIVESTLPGITDKSCGILVPFSLALGTVILLGAAVFSAVRVYAISRRSKLLFAITLCMGLASPAITIYLATVSLYMKGGPPETMLVTCFYQSTISGTQYTSWMMGARAAAMLSDGFVLLLTWKHSREANTAVLPRGGSLSYVLLRDNVMYFGLLFAINLVGLAVNEMQLIYVISTWIDGFTAILITRFMLDMREAAAVEVESELGNMTSIRFAETQRTNATGTVAGVVADP